MKTGKSVSTIVAMFAAVLFTGICGTQAFAADKVDAKTKEANKAHSSAPAPATAGAPVSGTTGGATGEAMQGTMSPEMTKWITSMKVCHKGGKNDVACHNKVIKGCEAKLTKEECATIMSQIDDDKKM